jgi:uncharacterized protein YciI
MEPPQVTRWFWKNAGVLHVLVLRYIATVDRISRHVGDHMRYVERWHADGTFVLTGNLAGDELGRATLAVGAREHVERVADEDPFVVAGVAAYRIISIEPERVHDDLHGLLGFVEQDEDGWDEAAVRRLRLRDLGVLREGRPLRPVLQHAGQALLATAAAVDLVRRCIDELRERDWAGDDVLVLELSAALGDPVEAGEHGLPPWPLEPVPVNLEDLADSLDGDPSQGRRAVDLRTGDVYHPGTLDYDRPDELNEDSDAFDPDRWLFFGPDSREGYRDMLDFASEVKEARLRERLFLALDGRGAFRRFRDALAHESQLARWHLFSGERALGRARAWLALQGYRSTR